MGSISTCNSGFTLIELLIVVAVIGILAAIALPNYTSYRTKTYNASAISDMRTARVLLEAYHGDNTRYP